MVLFNFNQFKCKCRQSHVASALLHTPGITSLQYPEGYCFLTFSNIHSIFFSIDRILFSQVIAPFFYAFKFHPAIEVPFNFHPLLKALYDNFNSTISYSHWSSPLCCITILYFTYMLPCFVYKLFCQFVLLSL